ncbi:hypothetical protein BOTBODRAFT_520145 [Botryobasidium botryosum FD-172 SS1]|uniref:Uncharacterized protein n=1 Tax=Botryobasidium botryosum (strain FD-172 SS1) TaxID=930990 RepID=A0A067MT06_BOTB1|nr:hypothetical protein BOTBODRAFT_520145 [Botryobasidium botryosum FD-172 SS1]
MTHMMSSQTELVGMAEDKLWGTTFGFNSDSTLDSLCPLGESSLEELMDRLKTDGWLQNNGGLSRRKWNTGEGDRASYPYVEALLNAIRDIQNSLVPANAVYNLPVGVYDHSMT